MYTNRRTRMMSLFDDKGLTTTQSVYLHTYAKPPKMSLGEFAASLIVSTSCLGVAAILVAHSIEPRDFPPYLVNLGTMGTFLFVSLILLIDIIMLVERG